MHSHEEHTVTVALITLTLHNDIVINAIIMQPLKLRAAGDEDKSLHDLRSALYYQSIHSRPSAIYCIINDSKMKSTISWNSLAGHTPWDWGCGL